METCKTCRFWDPIPDGSIGACHRFPPYMPPRFLNRFVKKNGQFAARFPMTLPKAACGEHAAEEKAEHE